MSHQKPHNRQSRIKWFLLDSIVVPLLALVLTPLLCLYDKKHPDDPIYL